jgi:putative NADH-flavin reductase
MRIAVFGGTGATGRLLIAQALDEGDAVTAYARHPEKLAIVNDRLAVVEGELSDAAAIERAVEGADGVISLLGQGRPVKGTPVAHGTRNILAAMKKHGVLRIVVIATASASDPSDVPPLRSRFFIGIAKLFLRPAYDDVVATAQIVRDSDRNWTIVRPPFLKDGPKTGRVNVGYLGDGVTGTYLSRANTADFMLKQLRSDQYIGKAPIVTDASLPTCLPSGSTPWDRE